MSGTTIDLQFPLENGIRQLNMRRPKVRDMLAADQVKGSDAEKEIAMFANLCEVAPADIEALDMADYKQLQVAYSGFLSLAPAKRDRPA